jgi:hypothetical protein
LILICWVQGEKVARNIAFDLLSSSEFLEFQKTLSANNEDEIQTRNAQHAHTQFLLGLHSLNYGDKTLDLTCLDTDYEESGASAKEFLQQHTCSKKVA